MDKKPLRLIIVDDDKEQKIPKISKLIIVDDKTNEQKIPKISKLIIVDDDKDDKDNKILDITNDIKKLQINEYPSDHMCYVLKSFDGRFYVGYTIDFTRRLRQHNGELVGGAKKTERGRPWIPICHIKGFYDKSSALRFEYRIQHSKKPKPNCVSNISIILDNLIKSGDGVLQWPVNIIWL